MRPADLDLDLDAFAGPFDLLCSILLRRELELADVQVVEIVVAYVQQLAEREQVDPDTASEFLLLIGALLEIKARELLASDDVLDIEEPAQAVAAGEMLERLVRYETFKGAAGWLGERGRRQRFWRVASRPVIRQKRTYDGPVMDPAGLQRAMGVLLAQPDVDVRHLVGRHASVHEMTGRLLSLLRSRSDFALDDAVEGLSRLDQAVAFVAALELCKNGHIQLRQAESFGPIRITSSEVATDGDDGEATAARTDASEETQIA
jgi:segregation and condensation protein A